MTTGPVALAVATGLGMASSSCSYAAVALARSLFRKGANFTAAMAFEIASTNLVIELGIILALLMGWQFTAAEFVGGPIMIVIVALLFRLFLRERLIREAAEQADGAGRLDGGSRRDGHDRARRRRTSGGGCSRPRASPRSRTCSSWSGRRSPGPGHRPAHRRSRGRLGAGHVLAGTSSWPAIRWRRHLWGPLIGPVVAVLSFVCSVGNVPLAAVLWNGGISFGGVIAFIFADLIILPIINIYRKYYGRRMTLRIVADLLRGHGRRRIRRRTAVRSDRAHPGPVVGATCPDQGIRWNYTTWLNIVALALAAAVGWRFVRTGGVKMLAMMGGDPSMTGQSARRCVRPRGDG